MISVLIVDYKTIEKTVSYIDSFIENVKDIDEYHFIIIDNSEYNQIDFLKEKYECFEKIDEGYSFRYKNAIIIYHYTNKNLGYGKGNNVGAKIAKKIFKDDYLLVSNNDIDFPRPFSFNKIKDIFDEDEKIGIVGTELIGITGKNQNPSKKPNLIYSLFLKYWDNLLGPYSFFHEDDIDDASKSHYTYRVSGAFMFVRSPYFYEVEMFDEENFLFAEEIILTERMLNKGYLTYYLKDISAIHSEHFSFRVSNKYERRLLYSFKSEKYYFKKYRKTNYLILLLADINVLIYRLFLEIKLLIKKNLGAKK